MIKRFFLALAAALLLPLAAQASPITYIYSGTVDAGSFAGAGFNDVSFVITAQADTDNILPWASADLQNTHSSASVTLGSGFGTFSFSDATHTWIAEGCCMGFGKNLDFNYLTLFDPAITGIGYDLATAIGPILDPGASTQGQFVDIATSGGSLSFFSVSNVTFQAVAVPEPETYALMALGLGLVTAVARRRRAA